MDPPILKKSLSYAVTQVASGLADWVDSLDPAKGIIAREYLPSGKALPPDPADVENLTCQSGLPFLKFIPPVMEKNPTLPRIQHMPISEAAPEWDWSREGEQQMAL